MKKALLGFGGFLFVVTILQVLRYYTFNGDMYFPEQKETYLAHQFGLYLHITGSTLAFILGPFQFFPKLRQKRMQLHRNMGKLYMLGVLVGSSAGIYMAPFAYGGFPTTMGFLSLAVISLFVTGMALRRVKEKRIGLHKEWMVRSYACIFAAATLRLYLGTFTVLSETGTIDLELAPAYIAISWMCWVPNLIVAEWIINRMRNQSDLSHVAANSTSAA
ncbi:MAG: hypothetical protein COA73_01350 [Candidatus Hydrogenedentota bacterium]|nr:MAG: hypothetical protein COA73_01350 [Candidatus Hydrogenedentota bacterium]